jgi:hypothetical protein
MANSRVRENWKNVGNYLILLLFVTLAVISLLVPLQRAISMGRFQHYAISISFVSLGVLLNAIFFYKKMLFWSRIASFASGAFFGIIAYICWTNPWLDPTIAVQTHERTVLSIVLMVSFLLGALVLMILWRKSALEVEEMQKKGGDDH